MLDDELYRSVWSLSIGDLFLVPDGDENDAMADDAAVTIRDPEPLEEGVVSKVVHEIKALVKKDYDPTLHPRWPEGSPGGKGGEFMKIGERFDLNGKQYEITAIHGSRVTAQVTTQKTADEIHLDGVKKGGHVEIPVEPAENVKVEGHDYSFAPEAPGQVTISAVVDSSTHDASIPKPDGIQLSDEEWARFGREDQEHLVYLMDRFGAWSSGKSKQIITQLKKQYSEAALSAVNSGLSKQYGSGSSQHGAKSLSLASIFDSGSLEAARAKYEEAKLLLRDVGEAIQWDVYNRTRAPDVLMVHRGDTPPSELKDTFFDKGVPVISAYAWSMEFGAWSGPTAVYIPFAIRHLDMNTYSGGVHTAHSTEYEASSSARIELKPEDVLITKDSILPQAVRKFFSSHMKASDPASGNLFFEARKAMEDPSYELPLPPQPIELNPKNTGNNKPTHDPIPTDVGTEVCKAAAASGYAGGSQDTAKQTLEQMVAEGLKPGDFIEGLKGTRYVVVRDPGDSSAGLRYAKVVDKDTGALDQPNLSSGGSFHFSASYGNEFYRLDGHVDLPAPKAKEDKGFTELTEEQVLATSEVGEPVMIQNMEPGTLFKVGANAYEVLSATPSSATVRLVSGVGAGNEYSINPLFKTQTIGTPGISFQAVEGEQIVVQAFGKPKVARYVGLAEEPGHVTVQFYLPDGTLADPTDVSGAGATRLPASHFGPSSFEVGDQFSHEGKKYTISSILKDGTIRAKPSGGKVQKFAPGDIDRNTHVRAEDWSIGDKTKAKELAVGDFVSGSSAKVRPYRVMEVSPEDKRIVLMNLETGEIVTTTPNKSWPRLLTKSAPDVVEPVSVPQSPQKYATTYLPADQDNATSFLEGAPPGTVLVPNTKTGVKFTKTESGYWDSSSGAVADETSEIVAQALTTIADKVTVHLPISVGKPLPHNDDTLAQSMLESATHGSKLFHAHDGKETVAFIKDGDDWRAVKADGTLAGKVDKPALASTAKTVAWVLVDPSDAPKNEKTPEPQTQTAAHAPGDLVYTTPALVKSAPIGTVLISTENDYRYEKIEDDLWSEPKDGILDSGFVNSELMADGKPHTVEKWPGWVPPGDKVPVSVADADSFPTGTVVTLASVGKSYWPPSAIGHSWVKNADGKWEEEGTTYLANDVFGDKFSEDAKFIVEKPAGTAQPQALDTDTADTLPVGTVVTLADPGQHWSGELVGSSFTKVAPGVWEQNESETFIKGSDQIDSFIFDEFGDAKWVVLPPAGGASQYVGGKVGSDPEWLAKRLKQAPVGTRATSAHPDHGAIEWVKQPDGTYFDSVEKVAWNIDEIANSLVFTATSSNVASTSSIEYPLTPDDKPMPTSDREAALDALPEGTFLVDVAAGGEPVFEKKAGSWHPVDGGHPYASTAIAGTTFGLTPLAIREPKGSQYVKAPAGPNVLAFKTRLKKSHNGTRVTVAGTVYVKEFDPLYGGSVWSTEDGGTKATVSTVAIEAMKAEGSSFVEYPLGDGETQMPEAVFEFEDKAAALDALPVGTQLFDASMGGMTVFEKAADGAWYDPTNAKQHTSLEALQYETPYRPLAIREPKGGGETPQAATTPSPVKVTAEEADSMPIGTTVIAANGATMVKVTHKHWSDDGGKWGVLSDTLFSHDDELWTIQEPEPFVEPTEFVKGSQVDIDSLDFPGAVSVLNTASVGTRVRVGGAGFVKTPNGLFKQFAGEPSWTVLDGKLATPKEMADLAYKGGPGKEAVSIEYPLLSPGDKPVPKVKDEAASMLADLPEGTVLADASNGAPVWKRDADGWWAKIDGDDLASTDKMASYAAFTGTFVAREPEVNPKITAYTATTPIGTVVSGAAMMNALPEGTVVQRLGGEYIKTKSGWQLILADGSYEKPLSDAGLEPTFTVVQTVWKKKTADDVSATSTYTLTLSDYGKAEQKAKLEAAPVGAAIEIRDDVGDLVAVAVKQPNGEWSDSIGLLTFPIIYSQGQKGTVTLKAGSVVEPKPAPPQQKTVSATADDLNMVSPGTVLIDKDGDRWLRHQTGWQYLGPPGTVAASSGESHPSSSILKYAKGNTLTYFDIEQPTPPGGTATAAAPDDALPALGTSFTPSNALLTAFPVGAVVKSPDLTSWEKHEDGKWYSQPQNNSLQVVADSSEFKFDGAEAWQYVAVVPSPAVPLTTETVEIVSDKLHFSPEGTVVHAPGYALSKYKKEADGEWSWWTNVNGTWTSEGKLYEVSLARAALENGHHVIEWPDGNKWDVDTVAAEASFESPAVQMPLEKGTHVKAPSGAFYEVVVPPAGDQAGVVKVVQDGEHQPGAFVTLAAADLAGAIPGEPAAMEKITADQLPPAEKAGFKGFTYAKYKGNVNVPVSDLAPGSIFTDKGKKKWMVKKPGAEPIITDGEANYAVDPDSLVRSLDSSVSVGGTSSSGYVTSPEELKAAPIGAKIVYKDDASQLQKIEDDLWMDTEDEVSVSTQDIADVGIGDYKWVTPKAPFVDNSPGLEVKGKKKDVSELPDAMTPFTYSKWGDTTFDPVGTVPVGSEFEDKSKGKYVVVAHIGTLTIYEDLLTGKQYATQKESRVRVTNTAVEESAGSSVMFTGNGRAVLRT